MENKSELKETREVEDSSRLWKFVFLEFPDKSLDTSEGNNIFNPDCISLKVPCINGHIKVITRIEF